MCPIITVTCSAENLRSTVLRWFFDDTLFALYALGASEDYPVAVPLVNTTNVGQVDIQILAATHNLDVASFLSTMTTNFSALQEAQISEISCGTFSIRSNIVATTYNPNNG